MKGKETEDKIVDQLQQVVDSIKQNGNWIGRTNRELRNEINNAAKQIEDSTKQLDKSTKQTASEIAALTNAVKDHATSNNHSQNTEEIIKEYFKVKQGTREGQNQKTVDILLVQFRIISFF